MAGESDGDEAHGFGSLSDLARRGGKELQLREEEAVRMEAEEEKRRKALELSQHYRSCK